MSYCKVCFAQSCEKEHTAEEFERAEKAAKELREALQSLVANAKLLEEK